MGNGHVSRIKQVPASYGFFHLRFQASTGVFSLMHANYELQSFFRKIIEAHWKGGLSKAQSPHPVVMCFRLADYDSNSFFTKPSAFALFCEIFESLANRGWVLVAAPDFFLTLDDPELIFRRVEDSDKKFHVSNTVCLRPVKDNMLAMIRGNKELLDILQPALSKQLVERADFKGDNTLMELKYKPWRPSTVEQRIHSNNVIINMFDAVTSAGYQLLNMACLDSDVDAYFFYKTDHDAHNRQHAIIGLSGSDVMLLQKFDEGSVAKSLETIRDKWRKGVIEQKPVDSKTHYIKLNGHPWKKSSIDETAIPRLFICDMLTMLNTQGWQLVSAIDTCRAPDDLSIFLFVRRDSMASDDLDYRNDMQICGIQPSAGNRLLFINMPAEISIAARKVLTCTLGEEHVQCEVYEDNTLDFTVPGSPWCPSSNADALMASHVISILVAIMYTRGYHVLTIADLQSDHREVEDNVIVKTSHTSTHRGASFMAFGAGEFTRKSNKLRKVTKTRLEPCDLHFIMFVKY